MTAYQAPLTDIQFLLNSADAFQIDPLSTIGFHSLA